MGITNNFALIFYHENNRLPMLKLFEEESLCRNGITLLTEMLTKSLKDGNYIGQIVNRSLSDR